MRRRIILALLLALFIHPGLPSCGGPTPTDPQMAFAQDQIARLSPAMVGGGGAVVTIISDAFTAATEQDIATGGDGAKSYGWNVLNSANADAIDVNTTNAGQLTINCDATATNIYLAEFSGVFVYKNITGDFDISTQATDSNMDATYEGVSIIARDPNASAGEDHVLIQVYCVGAGDWYNYWEHTTNSVRTATDNADADWRFLRITRVGNVFTLYSKESVGDGWTQRAQYTRADFASSIQVGLAAITNNTSDNFVARFDYFTKAGE